MLRARRAIPGTTGQRQYPHPYKAKGGAPCGVGWAACDFQSYGAAMRGVRRISDFEGWATRQEATAKAKQ